MLLRFVWHLVFILCCGSAATQQVPETQHAFQLWCWASLVCKRALKLWCWLLLLVVLLCVQAYVQFMDNEGAQKAREAINGRMFAGNLVTATYLTAQAYGTLMQAMEEDK